MSTSAIKDAVKQALDVTFLVKLIGIRNNLGTITTPISDAASLQAQVINALAKSTGTDAAMLKASQNEIVAGLYKTVIAMRLLVPSQWNTRNVSDWMYLFSYQIWSLNALKYHFGPKRHPEETTEQYNKRRRLGAKASLEKLERHISLVESLLEVFTELQHIDKLSDSFVLTGIMVNRTTLVAADAYLLNRIAKLSSGEVYRLAKIQTSLYKLQQLLEEIVVGKT